MPRVRLDIISQGVKQRRGNPRASSAFYLVATRSDIEGRPTELSRSDSVYTVLQLLPRRRTRSKSDLKVVCRVTSTRIAGTFHAEEERQTRAALAIKQRQTRIYQTA